MRSTARWFGQSAFLITADRSVLIDPFGVPGEALAARGLEFAYPPIEGVAPDLVLITHEHFDHNAAEVAEGDPVVLRATAGRLESPVGHVVAIAPRLVVPMHYRTPWVNFLEPPDAFLEALGAALVSSDTPEIELGDALGTREAPNVALLARPGA